jgi:hypothetical protein
VGRWASSFHHIKKREFKREPAEKKNDVSNCPCVLLFGNEKENRDDVQSFFFSGWWGNEGLALYG